MNKLTKDTKGLTLNLNDFTTTELRQYVTDKLWEGLTMNDIAKEFGISRRGLYFKLGEFSVTDVIGLDAKLKPFSLFFRNKRIKDKLAKYGWKKSIILNQLIDKHL